MKETLDNKIQGFLLKAKQHNNQLQNDSIQQNKRKISTQKYASNDNQEMTCSDTESDQNSEFDDHLLTEKKNKK